MDGTLTEELLDFPAIRAEIGVPPEKGILEHIAGLEGAPAQAAHKILHRHEMAAAETCSLHEGAHALLEALHRRNLPRALLTRNSAACARCVLTRHQLTFDFVATRDHLPHKPHPDSILNITRHFGVLPEQTLMVGDYLYDLQAACAAGAHSALLWMKPGELPPFAAMATYTLRRLQDVLTVVDANVDHG